MLLKFLIFYIFYIYIHIFFWDFVLIPSITGSYVLDSPTIILDSSVSPLFLSVFDLYIFEAILWNMQVILTLYGSMGPQNDHVSWNYARQT